MVRGLVIASLVAFGLVACGPAVTQAPEDPAPSVEDAPKTPEQQLKERFLAAYDEVGCLANKKFDPDGSTMGNLREPLAYLQLLVEDESDLIAGYMIILNKHGFKDIKAFKDAHQFVSADDAFWDDWQGNLINRLGDCPK